MFARLICVIALAVAPLAVRADDAVPDKGRKLLPRLFESAAATAADATVRVQVAKKDVILGTVVSADGYILTKGSELFGKEAKLKSPITCVLRDGSVFDADVVGYHEASDLMLLKVEAEVLTAVKFAPAKAAEAGNFVAVTGVVDHKNGDPETIEPVSAGVISSASRKLYMQEAVIENANRGFLGILFEMSRDPKNTRIEEVKNESARRAGLKKGDAIVAANDKPVNNRQDLFDVMNDTRPGETINLKVKRKGKDADEELAFKFSLTSSATMDRGAMQNVMGGTLSARRGGVSKVIQHDVTINPSQCGGPLVDLDGRVLGLNIARAGRVETWALPEDELTPIFAELKEGKHPVRSKAQIKGEKKVEDK
jgi:serine protease Do